MRESATCSQCGHGYTYPAGLDAKGAASPFPCQEFTTTLKNKKKSRADSLKSQRHPALEDKFDHCIT